MPYRPFRKFGRFLLAACAVSLGTATLGAQTTGASDNTATSGSAQATNGNAPSTGPATGTAYYNGPNPSRMDIFMGYSYFGAHGAVKPANIAYSSVDEGAVLSAAYFFNKYFGGEIEGFAYPNGLNDGLFSGAAGPIVRAPMQNFTLFAHALVGGTRLGGPNSEAPATLEHEPYTWGVGITAGGGLDYDLPFANHLFGLRIFEADYRWNHVDFGPGDGSVYPTGGVLGGRTNLNAAELSAGILLHVGHIIPPPPIAFTCALTTPTAGTTIYPGDPVSITGTATNLNPKKPVTYSWTSDAGPVAGTSNVANVDTKSLNPGSYTVKGHVMQGNKPGQFADCSVPLTITQVQPPTITCSANPDSVSPGQSSTITSAGVSPQNRPLTYSYSATAGSISGNTATATLDTTGVAPGSITVTCNVVDDKGQTASTTTSVTVAAPPAPPQVTTQSLCSISFDRDAKRPTRVDNEAKACLDDISLALQRDPGAKLGIVGSAAADEKMGNRRAAERAVNEKAYLVTDKGIDASRILVFTGPTGSKSDSNTLIPTGAATPDMTGDTPVDESAVKPIPRSAPARGGHRGARHHHKKK